MWSLQDDKIFEVTYAEFECKTTKILCSHILLSEYTSTLSIEHLTVVINSTKVHWPADSIDCVPKKRYEASACGRIIRSSVCSCDD
jgi:hypothetical protein